MGAPLPFPVLDWVLLGYKQRACLWEILGKALPSYLLPTARERILKQAEEKNKFLYLLCAGHRGPEVSQTQYLAWRAPSHNK